MDTGSSNSDVAFPPAPGPTVDDIAAALLRAAGTRATAQQVGWTVAKTLREVHDALSPILGAQGVDALVHRSVHLAAQADGRLMAGLIEPMALPDLSAAIGGLGKLSPDAAAELGGLVLHTFQELLVSLIGSSLTERLLRSVWSPFLSGLPREGSS